MSCVGEHYGYETSNGKGILELVDVKGKEGCHFAMKGEYLSIGDATLLS